MCGGRSIPIISRRQVDFSYLAAQTTDTKVVGMIDVSQYKQAELILGMHFKKIANTCSIKVELARAANTDEDPGQVFIQSNGVVSLAIDPSTTSALQVSSVVTNSAAPSRCD